MLHTLTSSAAAAQPACVLIAPGGSADQTVKASAPKPLPQALLQALHLAVAHQAAAKAAVAAASVVVMDHLLLQMHMLVEVSAVAARLHLVAT